MSLPRRETSLDAAAWFAGQQADWTGGVRVDALVPRGFEAYARLFHPTSEGLRWDAVAADRGRVTHPLMQWPGLCRSWDEVAAGPSEGSLPAAEYRALVAHLSRRAPGATAHYGFWEGFGLPYRLAEAIDGSGTVGPVGTPADPADGPILRLPHRGYLLFVGALAPVGIAAVPGDLWPAQLAQTPNLLWPDDRSVRGDRDRLHVHPGGRAGGAHRDAARRPAVRDGPGLARGPDELGWGPHQPRAAPRAPAR